MAIIFSGHGHQDGLRANTYSVRPCVSSFDGYCDNRYLRLIFFWHKIVLYWDTLFLLSYLSVIDDNS